MPESAAASASPVAVPPARVALSTASVYPEDTAVGFAVAASLGYDAVEVMVGLDATSQDPAALSRLQDRYGMAVVAIHAPCLLITQRVWGTEPWGKLDRSTRLAGVLGADTVVVHPPFRWQRDYARDFVEGIARLEGHTGIALAVENMYPWRARGRRVQAYAPGWDPVEHEYSNVTLDLSHSATAGIDPIAAAVALGPRLAHVHLADGSGSARDEHLVPGRGRQPCAAFCELLADRGFGGHVVVEVNTRRVDDRDAREADLAAALAFTRLNLVSRSGMGGRPGPRPVQSADGAEGPATDPAVHPAAEPEEDQRC